MMGRQGSQDNTDQLLRDLQATQEREQDLKEQLKFAEEEVCGGGDCGGRRVVGVDVIVEWRWWCGGGDCGGERVV